MIHHKGTLSLFSFCFTTLHRHFMRPIHLFPRWRTCVMACFFPQDWSCHRNNFGVHTVLFQFLYSNTILKNNFFLFTFALCSHILRPVLFFVLIDGPVLGFISCGVFYVGHFLFHFLGGKQGDQKTAMLAMRCFFYTELTLQDKWGDIRIVLTFIDMAISMMFIFLRFFLRF